MCEYVHTYSVTYPSSVQPGVLKLACLHAQANDDDLEARAADARTIQDQKKLNQVR